MIDRVSEPRFGDLDIMIKRKYIRVLTPYSPTNYYLENGQEKGLTAEYVRELEKVLNKARKKEINRVRVVVIPTPRHQLISGLTEGRGDIVIGNITKTEARESFVDFSNPLRTGVREIIVTTKNVVDITKLSELAGLDIRTGSGSSYIGTLNKVNKQLKSQSRKLVNITIADSRLEDEDLLEMVDQSAIKAVIVDQHLAEMWSTHFSNLKLHRDLALREGGEIAWAFRKQSPMLKAKINNFVETVSLGSKLGNIFFRRYQKDTGSLRNPKQAKYRKKLNELMVLFRRFGNKYSIDPIMLAALAFQESRFNNSARNKSGATGIMQLLPSTANDKNIRVENFRSIEGNIEAGAKYLRYVLDNHLGSGNLDPLEQTLFALASYNAGPNLVARVRKKAKYPNKWFGSVEWQVSKAVGSEPVRYVKNIYIYYVIFKSLIDRPSVDKKT